MYFKWINFCLKMFSDTLIVVRNNTDLLNIPREKKDDYNLLNNKDLKPENRLPPLQKLKGMQIGMVIFLEDSHPYFKLESKDREKIKKIMYSLMEVKYHMEIGVNRFFLIKRKSDSYFPLGVDHLVMLTPKVGMKVKNHGFTIQQFETIDSIIEEQGNEIKFLEKLQTQITDNNFALGKLSDMLCETSSFYKFKDVTNQDCDAAFKNESANL